MTTPAPSPLPDLLVDLAFHCVEFTRAEDAGDKAGMQKPLREWKRVQDEIARRESALVEALSDALVMLPSSRYDEETNEALNGVRDRLTEALSLARRKDG